MNFKTNLGGENPYYTVPFFFFYLSCCLNFLQTFNITGSIFFFSCADALEKRKFFSGLHTTDFDVNKFKEKNW